MEIGFRRSGTNQSSSSSWATASNHSSNCEAPRVAGDRNPFADIDQRAAIKYVQHGQRLFMRADNGSELWWKAKVKHLASKLRKKKAYYFVVMETIEGHYELRWDKDAAKAGTRESKRRIALSGIQRVTPTVLQDTSTGAGSRLHNQKFRIICGHIQMKLYAPTRLAMKQWVVALLALVRQSRGSAMRSLASIDGSLTDYIQNVFDELTPADGTIQPRYLSDRLKELDLNIDVDSLSDVMSEIERRNGRSVNSIGDFAEILYVLTVKEALVPWFDKYAQLVHNDCIPSGLDEMGDINAMHKAMSIERFQLFLELEQSESHFFGSFHGLKGPHGLFEHLKVPFTEKVKDKRYLTLAGFSLLMCCAENSLFDPARRGHVGQDMTRPLSHYWISASHNTYLEGHQLVGSSSLEQYIDVLLRGCRCVEIDCWDGDDGEPIVTHGWTATSRLRFRDVAAVCRDYAFVRSVYPLILSLEIRCSARQIQRLASILSEIFGDTLLKHDLDADTDLAGLVSPEEARGKVIVKAKIPKQHGDVLEDGAISRKLSASSSSSAFMIGPDPKSKRGIGLRRQHSFCNWMCKCLGLRRRQTDSNLDAASLAQAFDSESTDASDRFAQPSDACSLAELVYLPGRSIKHVDDLSTEITNSINGINTCTCLSLNEQKAVSLFGSDRLSNDCLRTCFRSQLIRIYPHCTRTSSGNFDPHGMWLVGAQMVALNYQNLDFPVICNDGLFLNENGGSGYVLKPLYVRGLGGHEQPEHRTELGNMLEEIPRGGTPTSGSPRNGSPRNGIPPPSRQISPPNSFSNSFNAESSPRKRLLRNRSRSQGRDKADNQGRDQGRDKGDDSPRTRQDEEDAFEVGLSCILEVTVLSGHSLPKQGGGAISPLVRVSTCGSQEDRRSEETWHVQDNGFNPRWHQLFSFEVSEPTVAMLVFEVVNVRSSLGRQTREFMAAAALPLSGLREGIRWVQLLDWGQHPIDFCGLLVEVRGRGPWAELRRQRRLQQKPVPSHIARVIESGPSGLRAKRTGTVANRSPLRRSFTTATTATHMTSNTVVSKCSKTSKTSKSSKNSDTSNRLPTGAGAEAAEMALPTGVGVEEAEMVRPTGAGAEAAEMALPTGVGAEAAEMAPEATFAFPTYELASDPPTVVPPSHAAAIGIREWRDFEGL